VLPIQPTVTQATRPGSEASVGSSKQRLACHHHIQRINSPFLKEAGGTATRRPLAEQPHEPNEIGLASSRMSYKIINGVREALKPLGLSPQCGEMPAHLDPGPNVRLWFVSQGKNHANLLDDHVATIQRRYVWWILFHLWSKEKESFSGAAASQHGKRFDLLSLDRPFFK
jgi:hypothetical protein